MALHLNLLHEEILEQRQRQRDPLKIGMLVLAGCGALLFLYYAWNAYRTLEIKARLSSKEAEWKKLEPQVTKAQKRSAELTDMINTTRVLDDYIDNRFFWGPFLEKLARCVPPNAQLTNLEASVSEEDKA
jgi:Tfp pilus assembly protein PilN